MRKQDPVDRRKLLSAVSAAAVRVTLADAKDSDGAELVQDGPPKQAEVTFVS